MQVGLLVIVERLVREKTMQKNYEIMYLSTSMAGVVDSSVKHLVTFADENDECRNYIIKRNKFYFSFENSLCKDYMTEKLFVFYKYRRPIIPVVRGALEVNQTLPKNTFINAADFSNARKLGKYLHDLSRDKDRYIAMLKEKDKYTAITQNDTFMHALCSVCDKMQASNLVPSRVDLGKWIKKSGCRIPRDIW
ncbi:hypothetical protein FSP39_009197 [Pinctada imbricata]|uniref:Fucosyltransferase n=1 Tax=Pinctada imbricata TaxID=66713 RepID=A0AA88XQY0_PINIB|nr:hypothetical protein FSP39_009197 [Pinctada imbricata]